MSWSTSCSSVATPRPRKRAASWLNGKSIRTRPTETERRSAGSRPPARLCRRRRRETPRSMVPSSSSRSSSSSTGDETISVSRTRKPIRRRSVRSKRPRFFFIFSRTLPSPHFPTSVEHVHRTGTPEVLISPFEAGRFNDQIRLFRRVLPYLSAPIRLVRRSIGS